MLQICWTSHVLAHAPSRDDMPHSANHGKLMSHGMVHGINHGADSGGMHRSSNARDPLCSARRSRNLVEVYHMVLDDGSVDMSSMGVTYETR